MKIVPKVAIGCVLALVAVPPADATATLLGIWLTEDGDAHVEVEPCGESLCGSIVWLGEPDDDHGRPRRDINNPDAESRDRPILGLQILEIGGMADKKGVYRDGTIYDPKSGKTYRCTARLEGDIARLRGFVGISLLGRTTVWTRVAGASDR